VANKQKTNSKYYTTLFAGWYYLQQNKKICSIDGKIVASKKASDIQVIADYLNSVQRLENELRQARQAYHDTLDNIERIYKLN
jgi:hypothetical protein